MQEAKTVAIIGAGPIGLAAAAHAIERGLQPVVLEAGPNVGHAVRQWAHVQLFSPWEYNIDRASERLLGATGWNSPDPRAYPTGAELVERYLEPLATRTVLKDVVRTSSRVTAISRAGFDKLKSKGREAAAFELRYQNGRGPETLRADAVIDASGTWFSPNPAGANGLKAFGGGANDKPSARGELGSQFAALYAAGRIKVETLFNLSHLSMEGDHLRLGAGSACCGRHVAADELIVATGFRSDTGFMRELRILLDPAIECPPALAPLIDPNEHSCGTVRPHGARELAQDEPGFYFAGMKSYGHAPTFLMITGYEQVRSIAAEVASDHEAAARVELVLPKRECATSAAHNPKLPGAVADPRRERQDHAAWPMLQQSRRGRQGADADDASVHDSRLLPHDMSRLAQNGHTERAATGRTAGQALPVRCSWNWEAH